MATTLEQRRKIRALEARKDALKVSKEKATAELAKINAELKHARKS